MALPCGGTLGAAHQEIRAMKTQLPLLCLFALTACSGKPPQPVVQPASAASGRVATPWDGMKADEQLAKKVQNVVNQRAAEQDKQIKAQTQ